MGSMIFLTVVIVLASGLIAYVGDFVGRKMGRKRLTLFGLRPRHTAIVISISVGMIIAILTLTATLLVNKGIRDAFFRLDQLRADLDQQRKALHLTQNELSTAKAQTQRIKQQLTHQSSELEITNTSLSNSKKQRIIIQNELQNANQSLDEVKKRLHENEAQLKLKREQLAHANAGLTFTAKSRDDTYKQLTALKELRLKLEDEVGWWEERVKALTELARASFSPLAIAYGQEIVSGLMPTKNTVEAKKVILARIITIAEGVVRQHSVELAPKAAPLIFIASEKGSIIRVSAKEAIDILLQRLEKLLPTDAVIVRMTPMNNVPVNGPAFIAVDKMELIPRKDVYAAGDLVARVTFEVTNKTTVAELLGKVADDLLREEVPAALRKREVISITNRYDATVSGAVLESSVSKISWEQLLRVVEAARAMRGTVSLEARSHTTVSNFGPIELDLDAVPRS